MNKFRLLPFLVIVLFYLLPQMAMAQTCPTGSDVTIKRVGGGSGTAAGDETNLVAGNTTAFNVCQGTEYIINLPDGDTINTFPSASVYYPAIATNTISHDFANPLIIDNLTKGTEIRVVFTGASMVMALKNGAASPCSYEFQALALPSLAIAQMDNNFTNAISAPTAICANEGVYLRGSCSNSCGGANTQTYSWVIKDMSGTTVASQAASSASDYTPNTSFLPPAEYNAYLTMSASGRLDMVTGSGTTGGLCAVTIDSHFRIDPVPVLTSVTLNGNSLGEICSHDVITAEITCVSACPTDITSNAYTWILDDNGGMNISNLPSLPGIGTVVNPPNPISISRIINPTTDNIAANTSGNPTYRLGFEATNDFGCTTRYRPPATPANTQNLIVNGEPAVTLMYDIDGTFSSVGSTEPPTSSAATLCEGGFIAFRATPNNINYNNYTWAATSSEDGTAVIPFYESTGATVSALSGTSKNQFSYTSSAGESTADSDNKNPVTYSVTVTDANGCTSTDAVVLTTQATPTPTFDSPGVLNANGNPKYVVCEGEVLNLQSTGCSTCDGTKTNTNNDLDYLWWENASNPQSIPGNVNPSPTATNILPLVAFNPTYASSSRNVTGRHITGIVYNDLSDPGIYEGGNSTSHTFPNAAADDDFNTIAPSYIFSLRTYYTYNGSDYCYGDQEIEVEVTATPDATQVLTADPATPTVAKTEFCVGDIVRLISTTQAQNYRYELLNSSDQVVSVLQDSSAVEFDYLLTNIGTSGDVKFRLIASSGDCKTEHSFSIKVYSKPTVSLNATPSYPTLAAIPINMPASNGTGDNGTGNNPQYTYNITTTGIELPYTNTTTTTTSSVVNNNGGNYILSIDSLPKQLGYQVSVFVTDEDGIGCRSDVETDVFDVVDYTSIQIGKLRITPTGPLSVVEDRICIGDTLELNVLGSSPDYRYDWNAGEDTTQSIRVPIGPSTPRQVMNRVIVSTTQPEVIRYVCGVIYTPYVELEHEPIRGGLTPCCGPNINQNRPVLNPNIGSITIAPSQTVNSSGSSTYIYCTDTLETQQIVRDIIDTTYLSVPELNMIPSGDTAVCFGEDLLAEATCPTCAFPVDYSFNGGTGVSGVSGDTIRQLYSSTTDFRVILIAKDYYDCPDTVISNVKINPLPGLSIVHPTSNVDTAARFCPTGSVLITANTIKPSTYVWSTTQTSQSISINNNRLYKVTATTGFCSEKDSIYGLPYVPETPIIVDSNDDPVATSHYLCGYDPDTLKLQPSSCVGCNVRWNTGQTTSDIYVNNQGGYYLTAQDANGCDAISNPVMVIQSTEGYNSPVTGGPSEICGGNPAYLDVPACVGCQYTWYRNSSYSIAQQDTVGQTRGIQIDTVGDYYTVVTNQNGCEFESAIFSITTNSIGTPIAYQSTDSLCGNNGIATLWTKYNPLYSYQWFKDGVIVSAGIDTMLTVNTIGRYHVEVTYANGCIESSNPLKISAATFSPQMTVSNNTICPGNASIVSTPLRPGWKYQWYRNGVLVSGATGSSYLAAQPGEYYASVTTDYLCKANTNRELLTSSSLIQPIASTVTPNVCFGDTAVTTVSLCSGCSYQWFDNTTGVAISIDSTISYRNQMGSIVAGRKDVYVLASRDNCSAKSNVLSINFNSVVKPAIYSASGAPSVCNGRSAILSTNSCMNCDYVWLKEGNPVIGGPNDTAIAVSGISNIGLYSVAVTYNSGCSDVSDTLRVTNGGYASNNISLVSTDPVHNVICNGTAERLITTTIPFNSQNLYTLFRNNTPVTGNIRQSNNEFIVVTPGVYTVEIENAAGCKQLTQAVQMDAVNISPVLEARATADPTSITASAICGPDGTVYLEASNCVGCNFQFEKVASPNVVEQSFSSTNNYLTKQGPAGTGSYLVKGEDRGCIANSNLVQINNLPAIDMTTTFTDTSICNGQSITMSYDAVAQSNCTSCGYSWLRSDTVIFIPVSAIDTIGSPVNGATNPQLTTTQDGYYTLEVTNLNNGCVDTSARIKIIEVTPPVGFDLRLADTSVTSLVGTPLATTGNPINLREWLYPAYIRSIATVNVAVSDSFSTAPYNAALAANAGLIDSIFTPANNLFGFHLVTYQYDTAGCSFETSDVLEILAPPGVTIANTNPASVAYEACVTDTLILQTQNLSFVPDSVQVHDQQGVYITIAIDSMVVDTNVYGGYTVYNTTIHLEVPSDAKESSLRLVTNTDTLLTPFLLVHNQDLQITGLPTALCSNGSPIVLAGSPLGGDFFVEEAIGGLRLPTVMSGDTLDPSKLRPISKYVNGEYPLHVVYGFTESYTNNNLCPVLDTVQVPIVAKDVFLSAVSFNQIANSQTRDTLAYLVNRTTPQRAKAIRPHYNISYSGSFTSPAGGPKYFLPQNAGIGRHALTYKITTGDVLTGVCSNSVQDSITVIAAPRALTMPDTICDNFAPFAFGRDAAYIETTTNPYNVDNGTTLYNDTKNIMSVYSTLNNQAIDTISNARNLEQYVYDVTQLPSTVRHDTIVIEYKFYRKIDSLGGTPDSFEYVIGKVFKPIYIEARNDTVRIDSSIVDAVYCERNALHLLSGIPAINNSGVGGYFSLEGGTGAYSTEATLVNNVINPYTVHNIDSAMDVTYRLIYYLNGVVCKNSDTMNIVIPERLNTAFATATGGDEFCDSDAPVQITHSIMPTDTAIWKVGGVPQSNYLFRPIPLNPGTHVVELEAQDTFGCTYSTKDTFTIHGLPNITFSQTIGGQYCTNDPIEQFVVNPSPYCPGFDSTASQFLVNETFDAGIPANWTVYNERPASKQWQTDVSNPYSGTGCVVVDTTHFNDTRTTLVTDTLQLIAGHQYQITFLAKVSEVAGECAVNTGTAPNAAVSPCNAKLRVLLGRQNVITALTTVPADYPQLSNDATYVPFTVNYTPIITGPWFLGLQVYTEDWGRSIRVDELRMRDITAPACYDSGIGFMSGAGVNNIVDSLYQFDPSAISPGINNVKYTYTNQYGCTDSLVQQTTINAFPVVTMTDLDPMYCDNMPAEALIGNPGGGTFTNTVAGNLYDTLSPQFTPATYWPANGGTDIVTYTYTDPATLCSSFAQETVVIQEIVDTAILQIDSFGVGYCEDANGVALIVNATSPLAASGVFSGYGVRGDSLGSGVAMFYPDSAILDAGRTGDMEITYIFPTGSGCVDTTKKTVRVHATPDLSWANLPDSICFNGDTIQVRVINREVSGALGNVVGIDTLGVQTGSFTTTPAVNFIGLSDFLVASVVNRNVDYSHVYYEYTDIHRCSAALSDSVRMDSVPIIRFEGIDPYFCENQDSSLLLAFPPYKVGSGYLQIGAAPDTTSFDSSFYWIVPSNLVGAGPSTDVYPVYYTYEDTRGCVGEGVDTFEVRPFPRISFSGIQDSFCRDVDSLHNLMDVVPNSIDYGTFTDNLALTSIFQDSFLNLAAAVGPRLVSYNFTDSSTLCSNTDSFMVYVFSTPSITYESFGGCVGSDVSFDGEMLNGSIVDSITNISWNFGDGTVINNAPLDTTPTGIPVISHQYNSSSVYQAIMSITNQGLCTVSDTQDVIVSPSIDLSLADYDQNFEGTSGEWYNAQPFGTDTTQVWQYIQGLNGDTTIVDLLNSAWVTAGNNPYNANMTGWLYTPCFDFTLSERPMVVLDMWRDMVQNVDGVVLEYYRADSADWVVVGDNNKGINWYQSAFVLSRPGQQQLASNPMGWTGDSPKRSKDNKGWEDLRFRLDQFKGQKDIRFRLAFASSPQTILSLKSEGVAVDNFWVGERTRNILLEHFSNENYTTAGTDMHTIDTNLYRQVFNPYNGLDVKLIEYHTSIAGASDINYQMNKPDADSRELYYGLASENQYLLNGARVGNGRTSNLAQNDLDYAMLQYPKFQIDIDPVVLQNGNELQVDANIEALDSLGFDQYIVHTVVIQGSNSYDKFGNEKLNVMRKMLPDGLQGREYTRAFGAGNRLAVSETWRGIPNNIDPTKLEVVVFVQNLTTKEVYQSASTQNLVMFIPVDNIEDNQGQEVTDLKVYPNPASGYFNVEFSKAIEGDYNWQLIDVMGRTLKTGQANQGTELFQIEADGLSTGTYFFVIQNENVYTQRKVVIVR